MYFSECTCQFQCRAIVVNQTLPQSTCQVLLVAPLETTIGPFSVFVFFWEQEVEEVFCLFFFHQ